MKKSITPKPNLAGDKIIQENDLVSEPINIDLNSSRIAAKR